MILNYKKVEGMTTVAFIGNLNPYNTENLVISINGQPVGCVASFTIEQAPRTDPGYNWRDNNVTLYRYRIESSGIITEFTDIYDNVNIEFYNSTDEYLKTNA